MKTIQLLALPVLSAMLVACGGGGGGNEVVTAGVVPAPVVQAVYVDKYVGVWTTACLTDDGVDESGKFIATISKKSDLVLTVALTATRVSGKNCTGATLPNIFPATTNDTIYVTTLNGVDRFTDSSNGKATSKITGSVLNIGNELNLDAVGYPVIDFSDPATAFNKN